MLPNWLLGKSKSKLIEELGGGGGGTSYTAGDGIDISSGVISFDPETTPAIDPSKIDGLDDDLAALAPKNAISNPNILHNPWFTVNQRAVTTVIASGNFIADRWQIATEEASFSVSISNNKITINNSSGENPIYLRQKRTSTYISSLHGKKLTASVMLDDGTIFSGTEEFAETGVTNFYNDDSISIDLSNTSNALLLQVKSGASVTIKALKLEVGEISTLHLDPRPEYATELAKCQRYFQRIGLIIYTNIGSGMIKDATIATCGITVAPLRKNLNTAGDVALHGTVYIWNGTHVSGAGDPSTVLDSFTIAKDGHGSINFKSSGLTVSSAAMFQFRDNTSYIDFNAEL